MSIPPAPPHGPNIGKVKDGEAVIDVDIMEKGDFKKQVVAWRWLGEDSSAVGRLVAQRTVALQKIDMLGEIYADSLDEKERKEERLKKDNFF